MAITVQTKTPAAANLPGLKLKAYKVDFDSSYPTGGEVWDLSADFDVIFGAVIETKSGYTFELTSQDAPVSAKIKAYRTGTVTPSGTNAAPTFTGTPLDPATKLKSKVIQGAAAGDHTVTGFTSTDKIVGVFQLNSIPDVTSSTQQVADIIDLTSQFNAKGVSVISNTGGTATSSKDELLVLFAKSYTPAGTVAGPTFTGAATTAAALAEVGNAVDLSAVTGVGILVWGAKY